MLNKKLAVIIPCMNEEEVIGNTSTIVLQFVNELKIQNIIDDESFICFVDDGSTDDTWKHLLNISQKEKNIRAIKLSRNFGHQNALLAGLTSVSKECDFSITIDADLQQDISVIPDMIKKFYSGSEIVFGVRRDRTGDTLLKKITGIIFVNIFNIFGGNIIKDHADFRLMGKKSISALLKYGESDIFLRGLVRDLGFSSSIIEFDQKERQYGKTKYTLIKMIQLAYNGVTSLTIAPLRYLLLLGAFSFLISMFYVGYVIYVKIFTNQAVPGWASIVLPIWVFSSLQLLSIGLIGEYLSKIFIGIKKRPRFIIDEEIN